MSIKRTTLFGFVLAALLAPATIGCDDGVFDRDEGPVEELAEEIDKAVD